MYFLHFIHPYMNSLAGYDLKNPVRSHLFFVVIFRVVGKDIKWNIKNRLKTGQNQFFYLKFFLSVVRYIVDLTRQYFHVRLKRYPLLRGVCYKLFLLMRFWFHSFSVLGKTLLFKQLLVM